MTIPPPPPPPAGDSHEPPTGEGQPAIPQPPVPSQPPVPPPYSPISGPGVTPPPPPPAGYIQGVNAAGQRTNQLAIWALVVSLVSIPLGCICVGAVTAVAGIVMGFIARSQIKRSGEGGSGLALGAIIVGFVAVAVGLLLVIVAVTSPEFKNTNTGNNSDLNNSSPFSDPTIES